MWRTSLGYVSSTDEMSVKQLVSAFFDAVNNRDLDRIALLLSQEAELYFPSVRVCRSGKQASDGDD